MGRKLVLWEDEKELKGLSPGAAVGQHPAPGWPVSPLQQAAIPKTPAPAAVPQSTTIFVEDPSQKGTFLTAIGGFIGFCLLMVAVLLVLAAALHLPGLIAAGFPDPSVAREIEQFWGSPHWIVFFDKVLVVAGIIVLLAAMIFLLLSRRRFGGFHIIRCLIGAALLIPVMLSFVDAAPRNFDFSVQGQPVGVVIEKLFSSYGSEEIMTRLFIFPGIDRPVRLAAPAKTAADCYPGPGWTADPKCKPLTGVSQPCSAYRFYLFL